MSIRITLQLDHLHNDPRSCERFEIHGIPYPVHISVLACDQPSFGDARTVHDLLRQHIVRLGGAGSVCDGPGRMECMAWDESSCNHILVPIVGKIPAPLGLESYASAWHSSHQANSAVIPAVIPPITFASAFPAVTFPFMSKQTAAAWGGSTDALATTVLTRSLLDEKPGIFLSYLRSEASHAANEIHDALSHAGYRTFLDRFSGTPGQAFPEELAAAMADMGLVVLLETPGLARSRWTMWEKALARRLRLGPIAVNFQNAPRVRTIPERHPCAEDPLHQLTSGALQAIVDFVGSQNVAKAVERRAYYETLVRLAAAARQGSTTAVGNGLMALTDSSSVHRGLALPAARPGNLRHVRRLVEEATSGVRILGGEHRLQTMRDRLDLEWLAQQTNVQLAGSSSLYRAVYRLL